MMNDTLATGLSNIQNADNTGKDYCLIKPSSKVIKRVLEILKTKKYIENFEIVDNGKGGIIKVRLIGKINKICAIKPRFSIKKDDFEKYEKRYLPAKDFGIIIISTTRGIMTHDEAKKLGIGGKLISFVY